MNYTMPTTTNNNNNNIEIYVFKQWHIDYNDYRYYLIDKIHTESLITESLTSSQIITNIHSYCTTSIVVEYGIEITYNIIPTI